MARTRAYTRKMRAKAIKRKKNIVSHWHWFETGFYPHDGMYSKGKIHCSCRMCRGKDYHGRHILTRKEKAAIETQRAFLQEEFRRADPYPFW